MSETGRDALTDSVESLEGPQPPDSASISNIQFVKWSALAFVGALFLWLACFWFASRLPGPAMRPEIHAEPLQTEISNGAVPFTLKLQGHVYELTPRFNYHLTGIVVSMTDSMGWMDISHKGWGDYLNTHDICVIWGANAESLNLRDFTFTHGDWTCYVSTSSTQAWSHFQMDGLSNNHVLPATPEITALIRTVHVGDEIAVDGQLVDYSIDGRGSRHTSTVRTDTGNGACEIIYVTSFEFLKRHNARLYKIAAVSRLATLVALLALLASLFILPFVRRYPFTF